jgi:uncharacterized membrane protein YjfL (UPF0719 family)
METISTVLLIIVFLIFAFIVMLGVEDEFKEGERGEALLSVTISSIALCCATVLLYTLFY